MRHGWFELSIDIPKEHAEPIASFLFDEGTPGLRCEEVDDRTEIVAYFSGAPPVEALQRLCADLASASSSAWVPNVRVTSIDDQDWATSWKAHFQPRAVGQRLYICPSWNAAPAAGRISIVIEPGMAFGTGQHPTTQGCLECLEHVIEHRSIERAVDVGTGSGILAIAMAKLGVTDVWAIDPDPVARSAARANAHLNGAGTAIRIGSSIDDLQGTFDLIVANLYANLLVESASRFVSLLRPHGMVICSGLLATDEHRLEDAYHRLGLVECQRREEESWLTVAMRRG